MTGGYFAPIQLCEFNTPVAHLLRVRHHLACVCVCVCVCVWCFKVALTEVTSCVRRFTKLSFMYFTAKNNRRDNATLRIFYSCVTVIVGIRGAHVR